MYMLSPSHYEDTLLKIEQNVPTGLAGLFIGEGICSGCNPFNSRDGFSRLGNSIGTNSKLKHLRVSISEGLELDITHREFFNGLTQIEQFY